MNTNTLFTDVDDIPARYLCPGCRKLCQTDEAIQAPIRRIEPRDPYYGTLRSQFVCPICYTGRNAEGHVTAVFRYGGTQGARDPYLPTGEEPRHATAVDAIAQKVVWGKDARVPYALRLTPDKPKNRLLSHPPADPEASTRARAIATERIKERQEKEARHAASVAVIAQSVANGIAREIAARTISVTSSDDDLNQPKVNDTPTRSPLCDAECQKKLVLLPDYSLAYANNQEA